jgi:hypothetical protein
MAEAVVVDFRGDYVVPVWKQAKKFFIKGLRVELCSTYFDSDAVERRPLLLSLLAHSLPLKELRPNNRNRLTQRTQGDATGRRVTDAI